MNKNSFLSSVSFVPSVVQMILIMFVEVIATNLLTSAGEPIEFPLFFQT